MQELLNDHASVIEGLLRAHGIAGHVQAGTLSPRLLHFQIDLPPGVRLAHIGELLPALIAALGVPSGRVAADRETGRPVLEIPRPDPLTVRLLPLAKEVAPLVPPLTATVGRALDGSGLLLRLDAAEVCPIIVAGAAGAGKSALLQTAALALALHNGPDALRLLLMDLSVARRGRPGVSAWAGLEGLPHLVAPPIRAPGEAYIRLRWVRRLMNERAAQPSAWDTAGGAALVLLIDGLEEFAAAPQAAECIDLVGRIAAEGRELGVYLIAAARTAGPVAQLPWAARVVGYCKDSAQAKALSGVQGAGAEALLGAGDFLVLLGSEATRFQAATLSSAEIARTVALLQQVAAAEEAALDAATEMAPPARGARVPLQGARSVPRPTSAG